MAKKECPPHKPLYNPKTDRCVTDNPSNRKKKELIDTRKKKTPPKKNKTVKQKKTSCPTSKPLYNPKTNRCVSDNAMNRKNSELIDTRKKSLEEKVVKETSIKRVELPKKKDCPTHKPLYNPVTNRCVFDTKLNRKKLGLLLKEPEKPKQLSIIAPKETSKTYKGKTPASMKTPSLAKKSLKRDSLKRMIPVKLSKKTYKNIWTGSSIRQLMGMYYLYTKHRSFMCFTPQYLDTPTRGHRFNTNGFHFITIDSAKDSKNHLYYYDQYRNIDNAKVVDKSHNDKMCTELRVHKSMNIASIINKCKNNKKRFFVGYIIMEKRDYVANEYDKYDVELNYKKSFAHANSFIYDIKLQTLEIFEPMGELDDYSSIAYGVTRNNMLINYFKNNGAPIKELYSSADFCPRRKGPQHFDNMSNNEYENANAGYCAAWSIFYLDMRLTYPNEDRDSLMVKILETFGSFTKEYINEYSTNIINTVIDNLPSVKYDMTHNKERLKLFNDVTSNSYEKRQIEQGIAIHIFSKIK